MIYDVIVIGSGPAGASAARRLAQYNLKVLMLEKAKHPRYKPCGGGLTSKVMQLLDFDVSSALEDASREVLFSYDSGPLVTRTLPHEAVWLAMRDRFDQLLAARAVEAGAQLRENVKVEGVALAAEQVSVRTSRETFQARFVVGADGANGVTAKAVGLMAKRHDGAAIEAELPVSAAVLDKWHGKILFDFGGIPWGYGWIFPKSNHLSVGLGTWYPSGKVKLRDYLARFIDRQPDLRAHGEPFVKGHLLPLGGRFDRFHRGRVLLAGDAAATADPFFGEGISFAIRSGQMAAREIVRAMQRGDCRLAGYSRLLNRELNADFCFGRLATHIFYRWPEPSFKVFIQSGAAVDEAIKVVEGRWGYRELLLNTVLRLPQAILRLIGPKGWKPSVEAGA